MKLRRHKKARNVLAVLDPSRLNGYDCHVRVSWVRRWLRLSR